MRIEGNIPIHDSQMPVNCGSAFPDFQSATRQSSKVNDAAFSLIEIIVVVALLSVIVLGLMAMFTQTQRAFRLGMSQTDVLESGRIATDLIAREMEQMAPAYQRGNYNFTAALVNSGIQSLPGSSVLRTNNQQDVFFLTRENQTWTGIGYFVRTNTTVSSTYGYGPVGTLFRFETNTTTAQFQQNPFGLFTGYTRARTGVSSLNVSRVLDGVVEFRVRAFDAGGNWIATNAAAPAFWPGSSNNIACYPLSQGDVSLYNFFSNAVPAFVELEIGILEPQIYEQYRSLPTPTARDNFMQQQAAHVHLFRQRVAIRNVDRSVYQ